MLFLPPEIINNWLGLFRATEKPNYFPWDSVEIWRKHSEKCNKLPKNKLQWETPATHFLNILITISWNLWGEIVSQNAILERREEGDTKRMLALNCKQALEQDTQQQGQEVLIWHAMKHAWGIVSRKGERTVKFISGVSHCPPWTAQNNSVVSEQCKKHIRKGRKSYS